MFDDSDSEETEYDEPISCPNCGKLLNGDDWRCFNCGTEV
jgi:tRNA(Ile2) C34 agmatinyltransferase TiaS